MFMFGRRKKLFKQYLELTRRHKFKCWSEEEYQRQIHLIVGLEMDLD